MSVTISGVKETLGESTYVLSSLCKSSNINKWSAVKPVSYNRTYHLTWDELKSINFGLKPNILPTLSAGKISGNAASPSNWEYIKPQGGASSPYRLGDFCVYNGTTEKGYNHKASKFLASADFSLDVTNPNAVMPLQCKMNGTTTTITTGDVVDIDLNDLRLNYGNTNITSTEAQLTNGYWRMGLIVCVPIYTVNAQGVDTYVRTDQFVICAKDLITTNLVANITTQSVRFNYGADNIISAMKRAMLFSSTNSSFTAYPCLVCNASWDSANLLWKGDSAIIVGFPQNDSIKINMSKMITASLTLSTQGLIINGQQQTLAPIGFPVKQTLLSSATAMVSTFTCNVNKPSGDTWSNLRVTIAGYSCSANVGSMSTTCTFTVIWASQAVTIAKDGAKGGVGASVNVPFTIRYSSEMKGGDVVCEGVVGIKVVS